MKNHSPYTNTHAPMYHWNRGNGYECSTKGDKRFSAFNAILDDGNSIEYHYQVFVKGYGSIKEGKGKPPKDPLMTKDMLWFYYRNLWGKWASMNKALIDELAILVADSGYVVSDVFATSEINQARALAEILNTYNSSVLGHCGIYLRDVDYAPNTDLPNLKLTYFEETPIQDRLIHELDLTTTTEFLGLPVVGRAFLSTGNVDLNGNLIMDFGSALEIKDTYPGIEQMLGGLTLQYGNSLLIVTQAFNVKTERHEVVIAFPVARTINGPIDTGLSIDSAIELRDNEHYVRTPTGERGVILLPYEYKVDIALPWNTDDFGIWDIRLIGDILPINVLFIK